MRITARLVTKELSDEQVLQQILIENLYQYPTERSIRRNSLICLNRLKAMNDNALINAIATQSTDVAKQICLYAMMKQHRLVWEFMTTVIGEKYRLRDKSYGRLDMNVFFIRLQEQDDNVAAWSDTTVAKIKQVLNKSLVETDYLDNVRSDHLNPVLLNSILENAIRYNHDEAALPAFNCFD